MSVMEFFRGKVFNWRDSWMKFFLIWPLKVKKYLCKLKIPEKGL